MKKKIIILISIIITLIIGLVIIFTPHIKIKEENVTININSEYHDSGYTARSLVKDYHDKVKIKGDVDTSKIGTYKVKYQMSFLFFTLTKTKTINVSDTEKPVITLKGKEQVSVCPGKQYEEEGYTVTDNYDQDLNDKVERTVKENQIIYKVKDQSGNTTSITRDIIYEDKEGPKIELKGYNPMTIYKSSKYTEPGYSATDGCEGDLTTKVEISSNVDSNTTGTYEITYKVSDSAGNVSSVTRTVKVVNRPISGNGNGVIYLTFDDGPSSSITPKILDILKDEGVKATFFVIGKSSSLDYLLKRESNEGHTIGLHSNTHDYSYVYSSSQNYFNDLYTIQNHVKNATGQTSNIIRFPGGSSNTVSRQYSKGIMTYLTNEVTNKGFIYFDWNVDSDDAGSAKTSDQVYNNVINGLSHNKTNVVLMHDFENNYKTLNALRNIIQYGKNNGYTFSNITISTPPVRHGVAN